MKGDRLLAVCDDRTLSIIDIDKAVVEKHTMNNRDLSKLFKLNIPDESGTPTFAGVTTSGLLKIWTEVLLDSNNNLVRKDMDPFRLETLKMVKSSGITHGQN